VPQNLHDIILKDVKGIVLETLHDEFGNHVVQRIIRHSELKRVTKLVLPILKDKVTTLSRDLKGCRIV
jgi:hypothetical protein